MQVSVLDFENCRSIKKKSVEVSFYADLLSLDGKDLSRTVFKIVIDMIETPNKSKRLLFDQFHSLTYPVNGFIWKDNIDDDIDSDPYEWLGDHIYTNMQGLYTRLTKQGYFIEVMSKPYTCIQS